MGAITNLRRQHDTALLLASEITQLVARIGDEPSDADAFRLSMLLAKLIGTLRVHFAIEDKQLYPMLMASSRRETAATARRFVDEMGQLGASLAEYKDTWRSSVLILADWRGFRRETEALFAALVDRITRENEELYPLAEQPPEHNTPARAA